MKMGGGGFGEMRNVFPAISLEPDPMRLKNYFTGRVRRELEALEGKKQGEEVPIPDISVPAGGLSLSWHSLSSVDKKEVRIRTKVATDKDSLVNVLNEAVTDVVAVAGSGNDIGELEVEPAAAHVKEAA